MSDDTMLQGFKGGLLLVDKPTGITSHDAVAHIRRYVRPLRVGHTGTLDPLASGLLILCIGDATKLATFVEGRNKEYRATALLGVQTTTQDVLGEIIANKSVDGLTKESICEAAGKFVGMMEQTPPAFSALKIDGLPAYKLARQGKKVTLKPRKIEITRLEIEKVSIPKVDFVVECSKGTYVRSLCSDLGLSLDVGGCLESLRRLAIGQFHVDDSRPLDELDSKESIMDAMKPPSEALTYLPVVECDSEQTRQISQGMAINAGTDIQPLKRGGSWAQALGADGELLAVGRLSQEDKTVLFHPKKVFIAT